MGRRAAPAVLASLTLGAALALSGCSNATPSATPGCFGKSATGTSAGPAGTAGPGAAGTGAAGTGAAGTGAAGTGAAGTGAAGTGATHAVLAGAAVPSPSGAAAGWALPGANLANTRDVAGPITSANVKTLGVAWTVPIKAGYATTPVVVNGVVYTQDLHSNVMAISLATGKVLWTHNYNSLNGGPDGVTVAGGVVYAATARAAVALQASSGRQLWSRTLVRNDHEGIDMAPGYHDGTVYVSTVPVNAIHSNYTGNGKAILWALSARTGTPEWTWDEVQNLWGKPDINSGGGQWYAPSFDSQGDIYLGVANPGPLGGVPGYPWGTSRPGPDLYTDSVVKLSPAGKLLWYYQLTPHDLFDWDLQDPPVLTTAHGQPVVVDGGKAGILIELSAQTGKLIWKLPVGVHNGHGGAGLLTEYAKPGSHIPLPSRFCLEPGGFGGIESQLASNGSTTFAAVNNLPMPMTATGGYSEPSTTALFTAIKEATGELVAVNQDSGKLEWADKLPSSPYGAASVTNNVVFTTTFNGYLYAADATTGAVLLKTPLSAGTNAPVTIDGGYVIVGAGVPLSPSQHELIIAYKLGAHGKLPDAVRP